MTARLAGGVNLDYIRLDSPDHQLTTNGGNWIYSVTDRWTNRIDQGEIEAPTNVSDCYPLFTGKILTTVQPSIILHSPKMAVQFSFRTITYSPHVSTDDNIN